MWSNPRIPYQFAPHRAPLPPLDGKRLVVHVAMNIEYWPIDRPMPRGIIPAPHGATSIPPDVPNFAWVEYGLRCGMPRLMKMLAARGIPASAFMNAQVADIYPALAEAVVDAGWELVGHGWFQQSLKAVEDEAATIRMSLDRLERLGGARPRAWLGCGLAETDDTPDILKAEGIEFLHDWVIDDLPVWIRTKHGPLAGLPYTFELNDVTTYVVQHSATDEILNRTEATLDILSRESKADGGARILTFGLHPHVIGVPHVAWQFEQALDLLACRDDTIFVTSSIMGDWFTAADPGGVAGLDAAE